MLTFAWRAAEAFHPVAIDWSSPDCGSITDGADTIVFQGVDEIILPACMCA